MEGGRGGSQTGVTSIIWLRFDSFISLLFPLPVLSTRLHTIPEMLSLAG